MERGTNSKWNDEKGFGFISSDSNGKEIFFHISAFPNRDRRPKIRDHVFYEVAIGTGGKISAKHVEFVENRSTSASQNSTWGSTRSASPYQQFRRKTGNLVLIAILPVVAIITFCKHNTSPNSEPINSPQSEIQPKIKFTCSGKRHCGEMKSKEEAQFYLNNCPHDGMDGDNDGVACEKQFGE